MKKIKLMAVMAIFLIALTACKKEDKEFVIEVNTPISDSIVMDQTVGTDLMRDGSQEVTLDSCIDGDTATFDGLDSNTVTTNTVRFQAIDTPETHHPTKGIEPWGNAAKQFTCKALTDAETIVLQLDDSEEHYGTYGRLLAFVWVDGKLLNAQLLELGLSQIGNSERYYDDMFAAFLTAKDEGLGFHGQKDPNWNYKDYTAGTCSKSECIVEPGYEYKFKFTQ